MRRVNLKSGLVIIVYSLILTLVFVYGIYGVKNSFNNLENNTSMKNIKVLALSSNIELSKDNYYRIPYKEILQNSMDVYGNDYDEKAVMVSEELVTNVAQIGKVYVKSGLEDIISTILMFFSIFIVASFLLWIILSKIHDREIENIIKKLKMPENDFDPALVSRAFGIAYENIEDKFKQNLDEYKRLNSYLSHEQKNAIAILRTKIEIDGNEEYLKFMDNLTDSIDDVLTLSDLKVDSGMTKVDVALICARICDTYKKTYQYIDFDFNDESNTEILAKERWIYRAISNLIDNAVKYGEGKLIKVSVKNKNNSVIVSVKDNGIGMDKNFVEKIFDNKYRINELNKDGYGIGLSLVSHVCDLCDGVIMVDSEINKGSCFYLSFSECKEINKR
ncbi:sensor histidine kinase [Clostridium senegalense]|uniref:histidine kinase n=1 Tax=Clostridium senegalense TaxID=1465809 RepID=A0A6M0H2Q6_9CLOT|nr:HAMP domain-containing sensor histidine kinase [Clostridium senegalense]NEU04454.1 HAMP domain-containing histidine kinase [Clostridium senegalense]